MILVRKPWRQVRSILRSGNPIGGGRMINWSELWPLYRKYRQITYQIPCVPQAPGSYPGDMLKSIVSHLRTIAEIKPGAVTYQSNY
ncbi:hypothetical protein CDAR_375521 [Caerostris darwini]|uniref:Uncharacterized protein n=1 Tax=Caerostris darwini TaxID=1538125 RepID=A0AAV4S3K5_9ARAC|nr:hypothetical protein CDAR_375521 [Caerostris darwini]